MINPRLIIFAATSAALMLFSANAMADAENHGQMNMKSSADKHAHMKMEPGHMEKAHSGSDEMIRSTLGPGRKSEFKSKSGHIKAHAAMLPKTPGWAEFKVKIKDTSGAPLGKDAKVQGNFEMPGMPMDNPAVKVTRLSNEEWQLGLPLKMAGMWKVHLDIDDAGSQDNLQVKFVTKKAQ